MTTIQLNGQTYQLDGAASVAALVAAQGGEGVSPHVAVAVNGKVVPRPEWEYTQLRDGDDVLVVRPVAGGAPLLWSDAT
jgi:thiamine biosynthesis protein ThiS